MGKNKLVRFAVNEALDNVIQAGKPLYGTIKGCWASNYFKNNHPIVLELGCGNGEYTVGLAQNYSDKNFIGVDIKGARIYNGAKLASEIPLHNAAFLRTRIDYINEFFERNEVSEIWITFPDPQPKDRQEKKRLTHLRFLHRYAQFLKPDGVIHLKTDSKLLFDYTLDLVRTEGLTLLHSTPDLYQSHLKDLHLGIKTKYENLFLSKGMSITYLAFTLNGLKPMQQINPNKPLVN